MRKKKNGPAIAIVKDGERTREGGQAEIAGMPPPAAPREIEVQGVTRDGLEVLGHVRAVSSAAVRGGSDAIRSLSFRIEFAHTHKLYDRAGELEGGEMVVSIHHATRELGRLDLQARAKATASHTVKLDEGESTRKRQKVVSITFALPYDDGHYRALTVHKDEGPDILYVRPFQGDVFEGAGAQAKAGK